IKYESLIADSINEHPGIQVKASDPNTLMYTSGSTGKPKGVLKSMAGTMHHVLSTMFYYPSYDATHKLNLPPYSHLIDLLVAPQFHLAGYTLTLMPVVFPGTLIITKNFNPEKFLSLIDEEK